MSRYRRSPITVAEPRLREQIDRELRKIESALAFTIPSDLGEKADQVDLDSHVADTANPHSTTHPQLSGRSDADQHPISAVTGLTGSLAAKVETSTYNSHVGDTSIHTPLPVTVTLAEAAAGTEPALRSWSPELVAHAIANLTVSFDIDALPELGSAFLDTDRMAVSRGGTEQRAAVTRIPEYVIVNPSWYGTSGDITTGTLTDGRIWTPAVLKTAIEALAPSVVTDHGGLTGLGDDDHPQYHTDARGDARYDSLGSAATVQSNLNSHTGNAAIHETVPDAMPQAEAETGTATTERVITAAVLKAAIDEHGSIVSGWTTLSTPYWYGSSGTPTIGNGTLTGRWRRIGDEAEIEILLAIGSTTSVSASHGVWRFGFNEAPASLTIDTSKLLRTAGSNIVGTAVAYDSSAEYARSGTVIQEGTSSSLVRILEAGNDNTTAIPTAFWQEGTPWNWADGDYFMMRFSVPISGWSA